MRFFFLFLPIYLFATTGYKEPFGKDADLVNRNFLQEEKKSSLLAKAMNGILLFHQRVISPIDGPRSHFRPTSSRYMQLSISRYGFLKGYLMGVDRLMRENNEEWVYPKIVVNNTTYKYDPAWINKRQPLKKRKSK